jgi:hypothetical protein
MVSIAELWPLLGFLLLPWSIEMVVHQGLKAHFETVIDYKPSPSPDGTDNEFRGQFENP